MFLCWALLLLYQLISTECISVTLYQVTYKTVTIHVSAEESALPIKRLPYDIVLAFSPSLSLSGDNVFITAKKNTSLLSGGTLELSLPRNVPLDEGIFFLFDRSIPHQLDETIIQLAVDSLYFSTSSSSSSSSHHVASLRYPLDEEIVLRRCSPLKAFDPFHQEFMGSPCQVNIVINEVSYHGDKPDCTKQSTFVTLYDGGVGLTNLTGFTLLIYEGTAEVLVQTVTLPTVTGVEGFVKVSFGSIDGPPLHDNTSKIILQNSTQVLDMFLIGENQAQHDMRGVLPLLLLNKSYRRCLCNKAFNMGCFSESEPGVLECQARHMIITEVYFNSQSGFIELYDGGSGHTLLTGYEVVIFDDQSTTSLYSFDLRDHTTSDNGFFVIGSSSSADMVITPVQFRPHTVGVALYFTNTRLPVFISTGQPATTDGLVDAIVFEGQAGVSKVATVLTPSMKTMQYQLGSKSYSRCDSLTSFDTEAFYLTTPSPGGSNNCLLKERHLGPPSEVFINEIFGAEQCLQNHYIELATHQPNQLLDNLSLVLYNARTGTRYFSTSLGDFSTSNQGLLILSREVIRDGYLPTHGSYVISLYKGTKDTVLPTTRGLVDSVLFHFEPLIPSYIIDSSSSSSFSYKEEEYKDLDYKFPQSHIVLGHSQSEGHPPVSNNYCSDCGAGYPCYQTAGKTPNKLNLCKTNNKVLYTRPYKILVGARPTIRFYNVTMKIHLSNASCSLWELNTLSGDKLAYDLRVYLRLSIKAHCSIFNIKTIERLSQTCSKDRYGVNSQFNVTIATIFSEKSLVKDQACLSSWSKKLSVVELDGLVFKAQVLCVNNCALGPAPKHTSVMVITLVVVASLLILAGVIILFIRCSPITKCLHNAQTPEDMIELHNPSLCEEYDLEESEYHAAEDGFI